MPRSQPRWKNKLRQEILAAQKILILAVGNPARADDAAGIRCAQELKKLISRRARSRLKIVFGYETPENTSGEIRRFSPDLVLILDAAQGGYKPGIVFWVEKAKIEDDLVSTHKISMALLISYLEKSVGCRVALLGIQPLNLNAGEEVSGLIKKSAENLAAYLASLIL